MNTKFSTPINFYYLLLFSCKESAGQNGYKQHENAKTFDYKKLVPKNEKIESIDEIDFDGDNIKDMIITTSNIDQDKNQ